jgi:2-polyprenyl-6-methoxyphenol hydroxylase-like FAD-dependent oxidoreductase
MRIACVGAGPAGLYLAILMKIRDPQTEVTIFEQNPAGVTHGWGVVFFNSMVDGLWKNDPVTAQTILDQSYRWIDQVLDMNGHPPQRGLGGGFSMQRQHLLDILTQRAIDLGVKIHFEHKIARVDELPEADLIVAADGVGSRLRELNAHRFGTRITEGRNKYVWLGTTRVFENFTFGFAPTEVGWIWFHAYGFSEEMSTLIAECSHETWVGLGFDRLDRNEGLARLEKIFENQLAGHRLFSKASAEKGLSWLNFRWITNKRWYADNIVLMGDAAHTTHFSIGSGTQLAIQDAISLADSLRAHTDIQSTLASYEADRQQRMQRPYKEARLSAQWFENVADYIHLDAPEFLRIMLGRRSALLHHLPPGIYCQLDKLTKENAALQKIRKLASAFYHGRHR